MSGEEEGRRRGRDGDNPDYGDNTNVFVRFPSNKLKIAFSNAKENAYNETYSPVFIPDPSIISEATLRAREYITRRRNVLFLLLFVDFVYCCIILYAAYQQSVNLMTDDQPVLAGSTYPPTVQDGLDDETDDPTLSARTSFIFAIFSISIQVLGVFALLRGTVPVVSWFLFLTAIGVFACAFIRMSPLVFLRAVIFLVTVEYRSCAIALQSHETQLFRV